MESVFEKKLKTWVRKYGDPARCNLHCPGAVLTILCMDLAEDLKDTEGYKISNRLWVDQERSLRSPKIVYKTNSLKFIKTTPPPGVPSWIMCPNISRCFLFFSLSFFFFTESKTLPWLVEWGQFVPFLPFYFRSPHYASTYWQSPEPNKRHFRDPAWTAVRDWRLQPLGKAGTSFLLATEWPTFESRQRHI